MQQEKQEPAIKYLYIHCKKGIEVCTGTLQEALGKIDGFVSHVPLKGEKFTSGIRNSIVVYAREVDDEKWIVNDYAVQLLNTFSITSRDPYLLIYRDVLIFNKDEESDLSKEFLDQVQLFQDYCKKHDDHVDQEDPDYPMFYKNQMQDTKPKPNA